MSTPTPWEVTRSPDYECIDSISAFALGPIANLYHGTEGLSKSDQQANAAHIVKCVNHHDELVAVINELIESEGVALPMRSALDKARAILAKLEES